MNVQFCSGGSRIPGFENRDMDCDIRNPLPYPDNSVDIVRCEHGAEHQNVHQCLRFFDEIHRILKPGGTFRLCIPVLDNFDHGKMTREHARDLIFGHGHECAFNCNLVGIFLKLAGFAIVDMVGRDEHDHHHTVIGKEKDDIETFRVKATK